MDHMMPDMDGFEVTRRIKASPALRDIPVIIVSGNDEASFVEEARQAGALDAMTKPPATEALESLLASLPSRAEIAVAAAPPPAEPRVEVGALVESAVAALRTEVDERLAVQAVNLDELNLRLADLAALSTDLEQRLAAGLAGQQARSDSQAAEFATLRETLLARLDAQAAELAAETASVRQDLARVGEQVGRLGEELRAVRTDFEARLAGLEAAPQPASRTDVEARAEAAAREVAADLAALRAELATLEERLDESRPDESRLRQLVADALAASVPAPASADHESVPSGELDRLRAGFKRLAGMTLLGGTVLLVIAVLALMRG
jgi:CheY-like chemotaxis protein